jgi:hypothetical protein
MQPAYSVAGRTELPFTSCDQRVACRFCVWDSHGRQLFRSEQFGAAVTSIAWRPQGDMFIAAMHDRVLLCNAAGWLMSAHQHQAGSAAVAWSHDGMACGMACGSGAVMIGSLLGTAARSGSMQVLCSCRTEHNAEPFLTLARYLVMARFGQPGIMHHLCACSCL